jgi:hypothetical protein
MNAFMVSAALFKDKQQFPSAAGISAKSPVRRQMPFVYQKPPVRADERYKGEQTGCLAK